MGSPSQFFLRQGVVRLRGLEAETGVRWAFTTRQRGDMKDPRRFGSQLDSLGGVTSGWTGGRQVHGSRVAWSDSPSKDAEGRPATDGAATARRGLALRVFAADCASVLLADVRGRGMALVHAGWRGAAKGIVSRAARLLEKKAGLVPGDLRAVIGPCIRSCCYEVGPEVARQFPKRAIPVPRGGNKYHLDLPGALTDELRSLGIPSRGIHAAPHCTRCDGRFHSFRRNKTEKRGAALAVLGGAPGRKLLLDKTSLKM